MEYFVVVLALQPAYTFISIQYKQNQVVWFFCQMVGRANMCGRVCACVSGNESRYHETILEIIGSFWNSGDGKWWILINSNYIHFFFLLSTHMELLLFSRAWMNNFAQLSNYSSVPSVMWAMCREAACKLRSERKKKSNIYAWNPT